MAVAAWIQLTWVAAGEGDELIERAGVGGHWYRWIESGGGATSCIEGLSRLELTSEEREVLFETFRVWLENDGSLRTVGELLFCHPNTVRYRLHRIEQRTGRSLGRPRDVAELCLAFEVHRRLMWEAENLDRPPQTR